MTRVLALFDRRPFNSPWIVAMVSRYGLPLWILGIESVLGIAVAMQDRRYLFFDARLYLDATRAWLAGFNPWDVQLAGNYFAAPPPTLLAFAPLALLPDGVTIRTFGADRGRRRRDQPSRMLAPAVVVAALSAAGPVRAVRQRPVVDRAAGTLLPAGALAVVLKFYAGLPLATLGRWRSLVGAAAVILATVPGWLLPWATYISEFALISQRLADQSKLTLPMGFLLLVSPLVVLSLLVVGRERAAWLVVPAVYWPSQQFYYGTIALPARSKVALGPDRAAGAGKRTARLGRAGARTHGGAANRRAILRTS